MTDHPKIQQGTAAWFEMVGTLMTEAAVRSDLSPDLTVTLVERYTDGFELTPGLGQGIRFEIHRGRPSFSVGVRPEEQAEILVEVTREAARTLNLLPSDNSNYQVVRQQFEKTGALKVKGDPSRLGPWLKDVHDPIVHRTA